MRSLIRAGEVAKFLRGHIVAPLAERAFGELHDIALVYKGEALLLLVQGKAKGAAHQTLGASLGHGFDAHCGGIAHFVHAQFFTQEGDKLAGSPQQIPHRRKRLRYFRGK